jgi:hypothetical protein
VNGPGWPSLVQLIWVELGSAPHKNKNKNKNKIYMYKNKFILFVY